MKNLFVSITSLPFKRSILFGLLCGLAGLGGGLYIQDNFIGDGYELILYQISFSAFVSSTLAWAWIVERRKSTTLRHYIRTGMISVVGTHFLCPYSIILTLNVQYWILGMDVGGFDSQPSDPLTGILVALFFMTLSLFGIGLATFPVGALIGGLYGYSLKKMGKL